MAATAAFSIQILASDNTIQKACQETLVHVYPGIRISTTSKEADLAKTAADLIVIDSRLIPKDRLDAVLGGLPDIPLLIVVADIGSAKTYRNLLSGRREMIARTDINGLALIQAVHHLRERQQLHEQLQKAAHRLKDATIKDELTHLFNHHHFTEILDQETKKAVRYSRPLGLILVDLKNFSAINEAYGHSEGDRMLARTADIIRDTVREVDIAARYGDNAFAVILPESDMNAAIRAGARIMEALEGVNGSHEKSDSRITVCMGITAVSEKTQTKEDILRAALVALSESKKRGGLMTNGNGEKETRELKENRQLITELHEKIMAIGKDAERNAFQSVLKALNEVPFQKRHLIPHSERVAFFAERLANKLGQANGNAQIIHRAGLLHDIGKLAIDPEILNKSGKLTVDETDLLHKHPLFGTQIIECVPFLAREMECVLGHHERFDGKGYPSGRKGGEIPVGARVLHISEAWDTMTSPQPYRTTPLPLDSALGELKKCAGKQFDPELVEIFSTLITG